jgi:crossover junction endonuclease MUS81
MFIIIDYREKQLIQRFQEAVIERPDSYLNDQIYTCKINNMLIDFKISNLPVGDFIIGDEDQIHVIAERKTVQDLCASITDGRFRQQKERLEESIDPNKILYIIEGSLNTIVGLSKTIIQSALVNLMFKHGFKVIRSDSIDNTFNYMTLLYKKMSLNEFSIVNTKIAPIQLKSKKDKIQQNAFALQLSTIHSVSFIIAQAIANEFKSMSNLFIKYNECQSDAEKKNMLKDVKITERRRIGKALSNKIYNALFVCN